MSGGANVKVCVLTSAHAAFDDRIFEKEARSLARAGHEVVLIAPHDRDEEADGIRVRGVPPARNRLERMLLTSVRVLRAGLRERAGVYHFHDPELIPAGLVLRALGKRVVYDVHEFNAVNMLAKRWIPVGGRRVVSAIVGWLDRLAARSVSAVVVTNAEMALGFRQARRVVVVHNYPEVPKEPDETRHNKGPVAVYVGGLSKDRGLEVLLEAGRVLSGSGGEARIEVFGPLDLSGVETKYLRTEDWPARNVLYGGVVPHREVPRVLRRARVGLLPLLPTANYLRITPIKLFEYMLAGLAVVASDFGVMGRIVRETGCGVLVPPGDPQALAGAIGSLLEHPDRAAAMGARGRAAVLERYNWESEERKLLELYAALASAP